MKIDLLILYIANLNFLIRGDNVILRIFIRDNNVNN